MCAHASMAWQQVALSGVRMLAIVLCTAYTLWTWGISETVVPYKCESGLLNMVLSGAKWYSWSDEVIVYLSSMGMPLHSIMGCLLRCTWWAHPCCCSLEGFPWRLWAFAGFVQAWAGCTGVPVSAVLMAAFSFIPLDAHPSDAGMSLALSRGGWCILARLADEVAQGTL